MTHKTYYARNDGPICTFCDQHGEQHADANDCHVTIMTYMVSEPEPEPEPEPKSVPSRPRHKKSPES